MHVPMGPVCFYKEQSPCRGKCSPCLDEGMPVFVYVYVLIYNQSSIDTGQLTSVGLSIDSGIWKIWVQLH